MNKGTIIGRRWRIVKKLGLFFDSNYCELKYATKHCITIVFPYILSTVIPKTTVSIIIYCGISFFNVVAHPCVIFVLGEGGCGAVYKVEDVNNKSILVRFNYRRTHCDKLLYSNYSMLKYLYTVFFR